MWGMERGVFWGRCGLSLVCSLLASSKELYKRESSTSTWTKPLTTGLTDLLILGLGPSMRPIAPEVRKNINSLGIRVDVQDTRNAAAQFNLLATERGVGNVAAALIPIGWKEPR